MSAVKLLAGVEPLLEAPQAQDLPSSWSLSSGECKAGLPVIASFVDSSASEEILHSKSNHLTPFIVASS